MMVMDQLGMMILHTDGLPKYEIVFADEPAEDGKINPKPWMIYLSCVNDDVYAIAEYEDLDQAKDALNDIYKSYFYEHHIVSLEGPEEGGEDEES